MRCRRALVWQLCAGLDCDQAHQTLANFRSRNYANDALGQSVDDQIEIIELRQAIDIFSGQTRFKPLLLVGRERSGGIEGRPFSYITGFTILLHGPLP